MFKFYSSLMLFPSLDKSQILMLNIYPVCKMDSFLFDADPDDGD
jgi:hypothetical protein